MNCPFCGKEMKKCEIRSQQGSMIYWQPISNEVNKMRFSMKSVEEHNGIVLCKSQNNFTSPMEAYVCNECRKFIMSFQTITKRGV